MHSDVEWENGMEGGSVHGAPGVKAVLSFFPESAYAAAVLANYGPPAATDVARTIEHLLLKQ